MPDVGAEPARVRPSTGRIRFGKITARRAPEDRRADRLRAGPLLDEREFASRVIASGSRERDHRLEKEGDFTVRDPGARQLYPPDR